MNQNKTMNQDKIIQNMKKNNTLVINIAHKNPRRYPLGYDEHQGFGIKSAQGLAAFQFFEEYFYCVVPVELGRLVLVCFYSGNGLLIDVSAKEQQFRWDIEFG